LLKGAIGSIAACEGKNMPVVEEELGHQIGLAPASIQRYKAGHIPPETRTIEILAGAAVQRGYLNREWLRSFLQTAGYSSPEHLIERLCPAGPSRPRPERVYQNLPAPTYSQFVMRTRPFADVLDGLRQRSALVLIVSLGGMGKTSLAREVASRCLQGGVEVPRFDAVVWVSDKDRPGTTTLSIVLDEIARTLDYPGFISFEHEEKRREIENLLRRQSVLLVIDNFETITDGALLPWLLRLPEPSKALVTSREYARVFRNNTFVLELRGMSDAEAQEFMIQRLRRLRLEQLANDIAQLAPLIAATGGNPKGIEIALGCLKYERKPVQQVIEDLYSARGELFDDLFARCWALLDEASRRVLLSMPLFPASVSSEALKATADMQAFAFDRAVERLTDLALLDVQQDDLSGPVRYALHPLVRSFSQARLAENNEFERNARDRWVHWYLHLAAQVGYCWNDVKKLEMLDPEKESLHAAIGWCFQARRYEETVQLVNDAHYYYYVRGLWDKQPPIYVLAADAARELADRAEETWQIARYLEALSIQGKVDEAKQCLDRLTPLASATDLPLDYRYMCQHATALYRVALGEYDTALKLLEDIPITITMLPKLTRHAWLPYQAPIVRSHWSATCLYRKGLTDQAEQLYNQALADAIKYDYQRAIVLCQFMLAAIALDRGDLERAEELLRASSVQAEKAQDRRYIAQIRRLYARLYMQRGDLQAEHKVLAESVDLFERLGMRNELIEAHAVLARLEVDDVSLAV
jgi:tetratricopeptide (TPR) repeat protein